MSGPFPTQPPQEQIVQQAPQSAQFPTPGNPQNPNNPYPFPVPSGQQQAVSPTLQSWVVRILKILFGGTILLLSIVVTFLPDLAGAAAVVAGQPELAPIAEGVARGKPGRGIKAGARLFVRSQEQAASQQRARQTLAGREIRRSERQTGEFASREQYAEAGRAMSAEQYQAAQAEFRERRERTQQVRTAERVPSEPGPLPSTGTGGIPTPRGATPMDIQSQIKAVREGREFGTLGRQRRAPNRERLAQTSRRLQEQARPAIEAREREREQEQTARQGLGKARPIQQRMDLPPVGRESSKLEPLPPLTTVPPPRPRVPTGPRQLPLPGSLGTFPATSPAQITNVPNVPRPARATRLGPSQTGASPAEMETLADQIEREAQNLRDAALRQFNLVGPGQDVRNLRRQATLYQARANRLRRIARGLV